jgi:prepilin-type N-terminal cleavage/methylation domain-containing protein
MVNVKRRWRAETGFSLTEMMIVVGIGCVLGGMATVQIALSKNSARGDAAMRVVLYQMNQARELAIGQRRYMELVFDTTRNEMQVWREDDTATTSLVRSIGFEGGALLGLTAGLPDTPDAFGKSAGTSFTSVKNGTFPSTTKLTACVKFAPDGTLVDWNGYTVNGTVFIKFASGDANAIRAVTVFGSTGRVRGYRWNGSAWKVV